MLSLAIFCLLGTALSQENPAEPLNLENYMHQQICDLTGYSGVPEVATLGVNGFQNQEDFTLPNCFSWCSSFGVTGCCEAKIYEPTEQFGFANIADLSCKFYPGDQHWLFIVQEEIADDDLVGHWVNVVVVEPPPQMCMDYQCDPDTTKYDGSDGVTCMSEFCENHECCDEDHDDYEGVPECIVSCAQQCDGSSSSEVEKCACYRDCPHGPNDSSCSSDETFFIESFLYGQNCGLECEMDTFDCPDGSAVHREPSLLCEFPSCDDACFGVLCNDCEVCDDVSQQCVAKEQIQSCGCGLNGVCWENAEISPGNQGATCIEHCAQIQIMRDMNELSCDDTCLYGRQMEEHACPECACLEDEAIFYSCDPSHSDYDTDYCKLITKYYCTMSYEIPSCACTWIALDCELTADSSASPQCQTAVDIFTTYVDDVNNRRPVLAADNCVNDYSSCPHEPESPDCSSASDACSCAEIDGCGWDSSLGGVCDDTSVTACDECSTLDICENSCMDQASTPCDCAAIDGCGWSSSRGICSEDASTSCSECNEQDFCEVCDFKQEASKKCEGEKICVHNSAFDPAWEACTLDFCKDYTTQHGLEAFSYSPWGECTVCEPDVNGAIVEVGFEFEYAYGLYTMTCSSDDPNRIDVLDQFVEDPLEGWSTDFKIKCHDETEMLSTYNRAESGMEHFIEKTWTVTNHACAADISLTVYQIDSWNSEDLFVEINGIEMWRAVDIVSPPLVGPEAFEGMSCARQGYGDSAFHLVFADIQVFQTITIKVGGTVTAEGITNSVGVSDIVISLEACDGAERGNINCSTDDDCASDRLCYKRNLNPGISKCMRECPSGWACDAEINGCMGHREQGCQVDDDCCGEFKCYHKNNPGQLTVCRNTEPPAHWFW